MRLKEKPGKTHRRELETLEEELDEVDRETEKSERVPDGLEKAPVQGTNDIKKHKRENMLLSPLESVEEHAQK